jgi:hypothetical protein
MMPKRDRFPASAMVLVVALAAAAVPAAAAPSIAVNNAAAMNGTNFGLEVTLDGTAGAAVVISQHPQNERTFNVSFYINPNNLTMASGPNGYLWLFRSQGNRLGPIQEAYRVGLKKTPTGFYLAVVWVRDLNSPNPGHWVTAGQWFFGSGSTATKVGVEWTAASDLVDDGSIRVFKNDVQQASLTGLANRLEVDNARLGHVAGSVQTGATGSVYLDEYVSTR